MADRGVKRKSPLRQYTHLIWERHLLLCADPIDESALDAVEERMWDLWPELDESDCEAANGTSADTDWLRDSGRRPAAGRRLADVMPDDLLRAMKVLDTSEASDALRELRNCVPAWPVDSLAMIRARIYSWLGYREISLALDRFAWHWRITDTIGAQFLLRHAQSLSGPIRLVALHRGRGIASPFPWMYDIDRMAYFLDLAPPLFAQPHVPPGGPSPHPYICIFNGDEINLTMSPHLDMHLIDKLLQNYGQSAAETASEAERLVEGGCVCPWPSFLLAVHRLLAHDSAGAAKALVPLSGWVLNDFAARVRDGLTLAIAGG